MKKEEKEHFVVHIVLCGKGGCGKREIGARGREKEEREGERALEEREARRQISTERESNFPKCL